MSDANYGFLRQYVPNMHSYIFGGEWNIFYVLLMRNAVLRQNVSYHTRNSLRLSVKQNNLPASSMTCYIQRIFCTLFTSIFWARQLLSNVVSIRCRASTCNHYALFSFCAHYARRRVNFLSKATVVGWLGRAGTSNWEPSFKCLRNIRKEKNSIPKAWGFLLVH